MRPAYTYIRTALLLLTAVFSFAGCGRGGTETGTSVPIDKIIYASKIESAVNALVPEMQTSEVSGEIASKAVDYKTSSDWDMYLTESNVTFLTDIFGPDGGHPAPETRIRVLMGHFRETLETIFTNDPYLDCTGGSMLDEQDIVEIAFYGGISNGTASDRHFKCLAITDSDVYHSTVLYGQDMSGIMRVAQMAESDAWNNEHSDNAWSRSVISVNYGEAENGGVSRGYLDMQYAQAILYYGNDDILHTSDDLIYKNKSRITGRVELGPEGEASLGTGDFTIIKYDVGVGGSTTINQNTGRGSFGDGEHSLFNISINSANLADTAGIYCLTNSAEGLPTYADPADCQALEENLPWEDASIPFDITPAIETDFASKEFFQANDTDLIDNSGNNFTIPSYNINE